MPGYACGGQRAALGTLFSPTIAWVAKTSTRLAGQTPLSDESSHQPLGGFVTAASAKETGSREVDDGGGGGDGTR